MVPKPKAAQAAEWSAQSPESLASATGALCEPANQLIWARKVTLAILVFSLGRPIHTSGPLEVTL